MHWPLSFLTPTVSCLLLCLFPRSFPSIVLVFVSFLSSLEGDGLAVYEETHGEKCHFNDSGHMHDGICCSGHVVRQGGGRGTERRMKRKTNVGQMEFLI
ncbi:uncharacterized [Tachysurus ichikawai]